MKFAIAALVVMAIIVALKIPNLDSFEDPGSGEVNADLIDGYKKTLIDLKTFNLMHEMVIEDYPDLADIFSERSSAIENEFPKMELVLSEHLKELISETEYNEFIDYLAYSSKYEARSSENYHTYLSDILSANKYTKVIELKVNGLDAKHHQELKNHIINYLNNHTDVEVEKCMQDANNWNIFVEESYDYGSIIYADTSCLTDEDDYNFRRIILEYLSNHVDLDYKGYMPDEEYLLRFINNSFIGILGSSEPEVTSELELVSAETLYFRGKDIVNVLPHSE
jgi:hypothetical protein